MHEGLSAEAQCMRDFGLMAAFAGPLHKDLESETALQACVALFFILISQIQRILSQRSLNT